MAYATANDLIARFDSRDICDLVSDSPDAVELLNLADNEALQAALDDASASVDTALLRGKRYTTDDLEGLTGNSLSMLKRIVCNKAMVFLLERRPDRDPDRLERQHDLAERYLRRLSRGEDVFDLEAQKDAGLPEVMGPTTAQVQNTHSIRSQTRHYFPRQRLPNDR